MPEAVSEFFASHDLISVRRIQHNILTGYRNDIGKHAPAQEVQRILMVMRSIPTQLSKENKKFIYGALKTGARAKEFELAIQWLIDAGVLYKVPRVSEPRMPLSAYEDMGTFKLFMLDCGLLGSMGEVPARQMLIGNNIFAEWKGAFTEQFVLQQLLMTYPIAYWSSNDSECKIDFLIQTDDRIIPIEVKAEENVHAKSFKQFIQCNHPELKGIRLSMKPYINQDWMENVPLFAAGALPV